MADVIRKATNRFTKGLIMDFSPENTKNEVLTNALNATLLTFNGNELSLQNDMGNGRVETAYLPSGYMPVGTCEYGGIVYIVSYNPLEDKSQIGCFPSPERNISSKELGKDPEVISKYDFQEEDINGNLTGKLKHNTKYVLLKNDKLNPGDKFIVLANETIYNERLADLYVDRNSDGEFEPIHNPILSLSIVSIEDSGKIVYLNNDVRHYDHKNVYTDTSSNQEITDTYRYHILGQMPHNKGVYNQDIDLDNYRNVLSSGYSVFKSKTSGKLAILAELLMIDSYSVTHELVPVPDSEGTNNGTFDIILHHEVTTEIKDKNKEPKLHYYFLETSQGLLQIAGKDETLETGELKSTINETITFIPGESVEAFNNTKLSTIYEPIDENFKKAIEQESMTLGSTGKFQFPTQGTYHGQLYEEGEITGTVNGFTFTKFIEGKFHRLNKNQITDVDYFTKTINAKFYKYNAEGKEYLKFEDGVINNSYTYYINNISYTYEDAERNDKYKNDILYKLTSELIQATDGQVQDSSIEKFQEKETVVFRKASEEELKSAEMLFIKVDANTYEQWLETPEAGQDYYIREIGKVFVSVGFTPTTQTGTYYYYPDVKNYVQATKEEVDLYYNKDTYPMQQTFPWGSTIILYRRISHDNFVPATNDQINHYKDLNIELYYTTDYSRIFDLNAHIQNPESESVIFIVVPIDTFVPEDKFEPNDTDNFISGHTNNAGNTYPKDDPIILYTISNFVPGNLGDLGGLDYSPVKLAQIKIPQIVYENGLDLPFKYDYTIVPCMSYGKLQHLAVSNTIDFSKLHAFNQSNFTTWKYRIDNNQLRLTFGAEIYDTYETDKVDALVIEFYDCWGFAASLEITDKKSYSGIFTKILPLNSFRALSNKKVHGNDYITTYKRNINIKEATESPTSPVTSFKFKDLPLNPPSMEAGWKIPDIDSETQQENNDCGTLYSNMVYGVKTYLRRTKKDGTKEFIKKRDFFLYTIPIYNDYYYDKQDFSDLHNPELEFVLTYKIKDVSSKSPYNLSGIIIDGYNPQDKANQYSYLRGYYGETELDLIKYYKYKGTTNLYLEVGLSSEYEKVNMSYDPKINNLFSCKLKLISDDDPEKAFTVKSTMDGLIGENQILNYNTQLQEYIINNPQGINYLKFKTNQGITSNTAYIDSIESANFLTTQGESPIPIDYEFVVGYTVDITEIRSTQVQATTVCALCHQKPNGDYNYEDFGVYVHEITPEPGKTDYEYLSNVMFYNAGHSQTEVFGTCMQINTTGTMEAQCEGIGSVETEATVTKVAGRLNSGDPLKSLVSSIGKLTFCQPHVHGFSKTTGVNIYNADGDALGIGPYVDIDKDEGCGTPGADILYNKPKYNSCLNTKDSIKYCSEFISTLHYHETTGEIYFANIDSKDYSFKSGYAMREYTGLTGEQLATFNKKLVTTMKSVYAYNPDYDSLDVKAGDVALQKYNPSFISNLLSTESKFNFTNTDKLNYYIYLGPVRFSNYLHYLNKYSEGTDGKSIEVKNADGPLPQVQFTPNYTYCGTKENNYLISSLTYRTPVPKEIEYELEFSKSNLTVVKHSNGDTSFLTGLPNKKALYGYHKDQEKMIQLDVSNYTINSSGELSVKNETSEESSCTLKLNANTVKGMYSGSYSFQTTAFEGSSEKVLLDLYISLDKYGIVPIKCDEDNGYFFMGVEYYDERKGYNFNLTPELVIVNATNTSNRYSVELEEMSLIVEAVALNGNEISLAGSPTALNQQGVDTLNRIINKEQYQNYIIDNNWSISVNNQGAWGSDSNSGECTVPANSGEFNFQYQPQVPNTRTHVVGLLKFTIKSIKFKVTKKSPLETLEQAFISTAKTTNYSVIEKNVYKVKDKYADTRLRGSNFTINDLVYEANPEGHRLFIKPTHLVHNSSYRGRIFYRRLESTLTDDNKRDWDAWTDHSTEHLNTLYLFTGPCYITDNLN